MGTYSIKQLEQLSGIKAHTIRVWEQRYQLITPLRTETNIRYYDDEQLKYLLNVALLLKNGDKVSKISKLSDDEFKAKVEHLYECAISKDEDLNLDLDANDLVTAMIDMDAQKFDRIFDNSARHNGFEATVKHLIYPFLEKIGLLWAIDQINPAHEHFMSCLIRQKMMAAIERLDESTDGKKFLLFLPEGEHHELGLLLAQYLIKKKGGRVYYMGQNLPDRDIRVAMETVNPDKVLTFIIDPSMHNRAESVIKSISACCSNQEVLIATRQTDKLQDVDLPQVTFLHAIDDLDRHV